LLAVIHPWLVDQELTVADSPGDTLGRLVYSPEMLSAL
jgi:hypothetical protein